MNPQDPSVALDDLRAQILAVDAQMGELVARRQSLVDAYERHRFALMGWPPPGTAAPPAAVPPPAERPEWTGARVRTLLLTLGAVLLGLSALTFTAVAWSRLGAGGRTLLLLGATAAVSGLAPTLRRSLPATAEALAGLAVVLVLVDAYAARRAGVGDSVSWQVWWAGATGAAAGFAAALGVLTGRRTTGFAIAALIPASAELLVARFAGSSWSGAGALAVLAAVLVFALSGPVRRWHRESRVMLALHAAGSWVAAIVMAGVAAAQPETVAAALGPAAAVAALAAAPALARRTLSDPAARAVPAVLVCGVPSAVALTVVRPALSDGGLLTAAVLAGVLTVLAALLCPSRWRVPAAVAGALVALPGTLWAVLQATPAVLGPPGWFADGWAGDLGLIAREVSDGPHSGAFVGSWPAIGALGAIAAAGLVLGIRRRGLLGISTAAIAFAAALAPLNGDSTVLVALICTAAAAVVALLGAALVDREQSGQGWPLLGGAVIAVLPAAGWAAVSPAASVAALAAAVAAGLAAAVIARPGAGRAGSAALAAVLVAALVGVGVAAAGSSWPAAGFAAAVAAGAVLLAGVFVVRGRASAAVQGAGAVSALGGLWVAAGSTVWLAGALTALVPVAAVAALNPARRSGYGAASGALALSAVWAWLAAAEVGVVEAYTAPAAAVALGAGILLWRNESGRSWLTLGPALLLGIGPTLVLGMSDDDTVRLIVAALLGLAAVVAGAVLRLQAPLLIGAAALLILAVDQWGDEVLRLPRWISVGAAGVLLMWIGATFERRRRDWRRASDTVGRFG